MNIWLHAVEAEGRLCYSVENLSKITPKGEDIKMTNKKIFRSLFGIYTIAIIISLAMHGSDGAWAGLPLIALSLPWIFITDLFTLSHHSQNTITVLSALLNYAIAAYFIFRKPAVISDRNKHG